MSGDCGEGRGWKERLVKLKNKFRYGSEYWNKRQKRSGEFEEAWKRQEEATAISIHQAMSTHLIAEAIFEMLSVRDLLHCSVVSKNWNLHARSVLRKRKCYATFVRMRTPCSDLKELNTVMNQSTNMPLNALAIENLWEGEDGTHECLKVESPLVFNSFMYKSNFKLKYLKISWRHQRECPAFMLIGEILKDTNLSNHLEFLHFKIFPETVLNLIALLPGEEQEKSHKYIFPNLKTIILPKEPYRIQSSFVQEIILASPKMEKLEGDILPKFTDVLLSMKKVHTVDSFCFVPSDVRDLKLSLNFVKSKPKINQLTVLTTKNDITWSQESMQEIKQILLVLYQNNKDNLTTLNTAHFDLFFFAGLQMPTLPNLSTLHIKYDRYADEREGYSTLSRINYAVKFPNLTHVILSQYPTWISTSIDNYLGQEYRQDGNAYACLTVTNLKLIGYAIDCHVIERIVHIFPNVIHLFIEGSWCYPEIFKKLWTSWPSVETLTCTHISDKNIWKNFDSVFTGLSEEDCETLRTTKHFSKIDELSTVNPSIRTLTRLKKLRLHIEHYNSKCKDEDNPPNIFITDVTGQYAFSTMPNLLVEINRNTCIYACDHKDQCGHNPNQCQLALRSISPFVTFVSYFDFKGW